MDCSITFRTFYLPKLYDIEQVYPDLVKEDDEGIKSVNYIELLIMEIVKLSKRVKELEKIKN